MKYQNKLAICLVLALLISMLGGCTAPEHQGELVTEYMRVEYVDAYGLVARGLKGEGMYIHCRNAEDICSWLDTVVVTYYSGDVIERSGSAWVRPGGGWGNYMYKVEYQRALQSVEEIRLSDPSKGEPLFD